MKKIMFSLLLIGMMSQATQSIAGPVRPRSTKAQQATGARLSASKLLPPAPPDGHRH